ncbi:MAG: hypothetical protein HKN26_12260, partial [Acidimicrobiales bacterium]|nr:hypothetical protein [Acidimicrobiales bacterium]
AQSDDLAGSLTGYSELLSHWYRLANWVNLGNAIRLFAGFLAENGHDESAAVVLGGLTSVVERALGSLQIREREDALSSIEERLPHRAMETLTTRGAALDMRGLVEFCQAEISRILTSLDHPTGGSGR